jgi:hypothetical protein
MPNNIEIKANSSDLVKYGAVTKLFEIVLALIVLSVFVAFFPGIKTNYDTSGNQIREFNKRVGECKLKQLEQYGTMDGIACRRYVNAQMGVYANY